MKKTLVMMLAALSMSAVSNVYAQSSALEWKSEDGTDSVKLGGVVRLNQRYENWEGPNGGFGKLYFDIFRVDLKGKFDDAYFNASYLFQD